jgi:hypothetical protein
MPGPEKTKNPFEADSVLEEVEQANKALSDQITELQVKPVEKKRDDGGPAFPHWVETNNRGDRGDFIRFPAPGALTLRDYLAAKAMAAFIVADTEAALSEDKISAWAYSQADAMLKERRR